MQTKSIATGAVPLELAATVGAALVRRHQTVAVAESCTGGLLAAALTSGSGSSRFFRGGVVVYSDGLKIALVGVVAEVLRAQGAVSAPVARQLAQGARERLGADWGIGITGIAGPTGARPGKPVGTVFIGIAGPAMAARATRRRFAGNRERVRNLAVQAALQQLELRLS